MSLFNFFKKNGEVKNHYNNDNVDNNLVNQHDCEQVEDDEDEITAVISAVLASIEDDTETVAAIVAAISCVIGKNTGEFVVRNIKRSPELDSIWAQAGRMKLMR